MRKHHRYQRMNQHKKQAAIEAKWSLIIMNDIKICEQLPVSSERTLPADPFPRKYVHSVMYDLQYAVQAVQALRTAGYDARDIHVMASWDFVEAIERRRRQQGHLSKALMRLFTFFDEGFGDVYLHEALQGHHILAVRLSQNEQMGQMRDLLAAYCAHCIKYVDTWTVSDLLPFPEHSV
jgi:hypothetical protein